MVSTCGRIHILLRAVRARKQAPFGTKMFFPELLQTESFRASADGQVTTVHL